MIGNDERRRVAERLRCAAEQRQPYTQPTLACFIEADCMDIWTRLADLIDSAENVRYIATVKVEGEKLEELAKEVAAEYARIDREALAGIAREMERLALHCFRKDLHVSPAAVGDFAYRIRKAIREVPDDHE